MGGFEDSMNRLKKEQLDRLEIAIIEVSKTFQEVSKTSQEVDATFGRLNDVLQHNDDDTREA